MNQFTVNDKIRLEAVNLSMTDQIFTAIESNREFLGRWLPFVAYTRQVSDTRKFMESIINQTEEQKDEIYSIFYNEEFSGLIGFKETDWINRKTELGYWLIEKMQKKGIVTLCVHKLTRYAFQKLKMNRVQIKVAVGNKQSAAIPQRLDFKFEGIERAGEKHGSDYLDLEIYSLLKSDLH